MQPGTPRHRRTRVPLLSSDPGGVHPFALHGTRLQFHTVAQKIYCQTETYAKALGRFPKVHRKGIPITFRYIGCRIRIIFTEKPCVF